MTSTASAEALSQRTFVITSALLFTVSAALTIRLCASMSAMGEMAMPGGWSMSMMWMRMPEQDWFGAAASFVGMWIVMTLAMMLPSLVATLWRCRDRLAALVAIGYFFVWTVVGLVVFPLSVTVAAVAMQQPALARAVPSTVGLVVLVAGAFQFSERKARHLECCRKAPGPIGAPPMKLRGAVGRGIRLGLHCCYCTAGFTAILLVAGVMDLRAMALVTAAISAERLAPSGRVSQGVGVLLTAAGLFLVARAGWLG
jgi:predicted metal-binding membrane protein